MRSNSPWKAFCFRPLRLCTLHTHRLYISANMRCTAYLGGWAKNPRKTGRLATMREPILTMLREHPEGLNAEQIRALLNPEKPIGDTLQGLRKAGVVRFEGSGKARRYFVG